MNASASVPGTPPGCERIAYVLGFQGPTISVDTACSSTVVATHLAVAGIRTSECEMALAGGVNMLLTPDLSINFSKAHMLSPDGRCFTFDARANGYVRGEGCGMNLLKPLADAQDAGDNIIACIRGSAINQDGRSSGLTAPNGPQQQAVIRTALADGGVEASDVGEAVRLMTAATLQVRAKRRRPHAAAHAALNILHATSRASPCRPTPPFVR